MGQGAATVLGDAIHWRAIHWRFSSARWAKGPLQFSVMPYIGVPHIGASRLLGGPGGRYSTRWCHTLACHTWALHVNHLLPSMPDHLEQDTYHQILNTTQCAAQDTNRQKFERCECCCWYLLYSHPGDLLIIASRKTGRWIPKLQLSGVRWFGAERPNYRGAFYIPGRRLP